MSERKKLSRFQIIALLIAGLYILDLIQSVVQYLGSGQWNKLAVNLIALGIIISVLYIFRNNIKQGWSGLMAHREASKEKFESSRGNTSLRDAVIFSLAWSREIYKSIPEDRKNLVKTSFILIGIAFGIMFLKGGEYGYISLLIIFGLLIAGVNLLIWVMGSERQEKERMEIELEAARKMQLSLMPAQAPQIEGFDISGCCIPAQNVGGDMFDFVWSGKDQSKLCIPVVDVSGKGMDAAFTAVYTSGAIISETQHEDDVEAVMGNLNSAIYSRQNRSRFVSLLLVELDTIARQIEYVNAGQVKPFLVRKNQLSILKGTGPRFPLGLRESTLYRQDIIKLQPQDVLLLYTDGVTEAMNFDQDMFGEERLKELFLLLVQQQMDAAGIVNSIKNTVLDFSGIDHQHDDLTIVVIRVL